ncbi:hypothetical protein V5O48_015329, partial [Marasmius crinis-equi]
MKLATAVVAAYMASTSVVSAWHLSLYRDTNYQNVILDTSGTVASPCQQLDSRANDKASSMHWLGSPLGNEVVLYADNVCFVELGRFRGIWDIPVFTILQDDK